ncbi:MAG: nucleoside-triphosphatase, partial [Candidatus Acidiferrales bacterium]
MNLLLTGRPRAGKTTLVERVVERLRRQAPGLRLAGFTTTEIRDASGERSGF